MSSFISKLINLAGNITGILPVLNGGTGVSTSTGTTNVVLSNGPTLVAPILGTPASGNLSNCTSYPAATSSTAGTITIQATTTATLTFTQAGGYSQAVTATFTRLGNFVYIEVPHFAGTATATAAISSGASDIPSGYRPAVAQYQLAIVNINAGTLASGAMAITTGGQITIYATVGGGPFTSGLSVGLNDTSSNGAWLYKGA